MSDKKDNLSSSKVAMISFFSLLLVLSVGMTVNITISLFTSRTSANAATATGAAAAAAAADTSTPSQQLLKPSPRRTQALLSPSSSTAASPIMTNQVAFWGALMAAFMESFGLVYFLNAVNVQTFGEAVRSGWICWLFLIFPASVLQFIYYGQHRVRGGEAEEQAVLRLAGGQLLRVMGESVCMAWMIFLLRK